MHQLLLLLRLVVLLRGNPVDGQVVPWNLSLTHRVALVSNVFLLRVIRLCLKNVLVIIQNVRGRFLHV